MFRNAHLAPLYPELLVNTVDHLRPIASDNNLLSSGHTSVRDPNQSKREERMHVDGLRI